MIYNFTIRLYAAVFSLVGLFHQKARARVKSQRNYVQMVAKRDISRALVWFHCASLGEFEQGKPVLEAFRKQYPQWQILVTFFSPSGYEIRKNYAHADLICYLPFDIKTDVVKFFDCLRPNLAIFVKYEFWRNFIGEARLRKIPLISISSIFRQNQVYFKPWGKSQLKVLQDVTHFFVQNEKSANLMAKFGLTDITVAGDTRFDRVTDTLAQIRPILAAEEFKNGQLLMVCGSVWPDDMEILIPFINKNPQLKFIIAPHEIDLTQIEVWKQNIENKAINYSYQDSFVDYQVLFIDNVGMLSSLYQYANFAFIGGAFGAGLHNILEAAVFGTPIFFGNKNFAKFQEANDLISKQVAFVISGSEALQSHYNDLNSSTLNKIRDEARSYINQNTGATTIIIGWISRNIEDCRRL